MPNWFRPTSLPILPLGAPDQGYDTFRVTSPFGPRIRDGKREIHTGIDIGNLRAGDEVVAAADGFVVDEGWLGPPWSSPKPIGAKWTGQFYGGVMAVLDHGDAVTSSAHMSRTIVGRGQQVRAGQVIGYVGDTGSAKGQAHLHFEVWVNGARIDPLPLLVSEAPLTPPTPPLPPPETPAQREKRLADEVVELRKAHPEAAARWVLNTGMTQDIDGQRLTRERRLSAEVTFLREVAATR